MRIQKAEELLKLLKDGIDPTEMLDYQEAIQLGIEALTQMTHERTIYGFKRHNRMPGETEE